MDKKNQQRQQQKITKQAPAASYYHSIAKTKRFTFTVLIQLLLNCSAI